MSVLRQDGESSLIVLESDCADAPDENEGVKVWVSYGENSYVYLDDDRDDKVTANIMTAVFKIGVPFLAIVLPAVFYLRRQRAT